MARTRSDVTIREGTGKKYWYTMMAHVAISIAGLAIFGYLTATTSTQTDVAAAGSIGFLVLLGSLVLGVVSIPALFKDSAYLRETARRWKPKWWYYIGGGLAPAVVLFVAADLFGGGVGGVVLALLGLILGTVLMNSVYLYRRHQQIGVP